MLLVENLGCARVEFCFQAIDFYQNGLSVTFTPNELKLWPICFIAMDKKGLGGMNFFSLKVINMEANILWTGLQ